MEIKADLSPAIIKGTDFTVTLLSFFGRIFGPTVESAGSMLRDQMQSWQAANLDRLHKKWLKKREEKGISEEAVKHLPFSLGSRLISGAAKEDDDTVQELWANLLNAATNPQSSADVKRVHVELLESITAVEARILEFMWLRLSDNDNSPGMIVSHRVSDFEKTHLRIFALEDRALALQNLIRLCCVRPTIDRFDLSKIDAGTRGTFFRQDLERDDMHEAMRAIKKIIENLSGNAEPFNLGLHLQKENREGWLPELYYQLTGLGADLMRACYSSAIP
jgi:hypothetical protein